MLTEEEIDNLWKEKGNKFFHETLPDVIEWKCTFWDYLWSRWETVIVKSNSCQRAEKYIEHHYSCSDLRAYPNTSRGREASLRAYFD